MSDINVWVKGFNDEFDAQRRAIPKAYAYGNDIRRLSKDAIKAAIDMNNEEFARISSEIQEIWEKMGELDLPKTFAAFQDFDAAQEIVEAYASFAMFKVIRDGDGTMSAVDWDSFSPDVLMVTPQAWLFGLLDAGSELSRIVNRYIIGAKFVRGYRKTLRQRYLRIAYELNDILDHFSETTPAVLDAYNKYGFRQSFRSKLGQLRGAIEAQERYLLESIERED